MLITPVVNTAQLKQLYYNNLLYGENSRRDNRARHLYGYDTRTFAASALAQPDYSRVWGGDSSHWDGNVDMSTAKSRGASFWFFKAMDGTLTTKYFLANRERALNANLPHGAYVWLYRNANVSCVAQAQAATNLLTAYPSILPTVVDFEWTKWGGLPSNPNYNDLRMWVVEWLRLGNPKPILYSAKGYMGEFGKIPDDLKAMFADIWISNIGVLAPNMPLGYMADEWEFWQWTFSGDQEYLCPSDIGKKELDLNYFNGTFAEFSHKYLGGEIPPPTGATMQIGTIKDGITLNYRDGVGTSYNSLGTVTAGNQVIGVIDVLTNWFKIDHLIKGGVKVVPPKQAYCSAYNIAPNGYYTKIEDYVPPVDPTPTQKLNLSLDLADNGTVSGTWNEVT